MAYWNDPRGMADELNATWAALAALLASLANGPDPSVVAAAKHAQDILNRREGNIDD